ncbi:hypothetical protein FHG66_20305 [Rubellimicrobium rubrum]|uniref:Exonuclease domain-containing protein n=1 Tax=Rubellimicrobium rubrum TaxID=2585369 RepID=A0A5C4MLM7_9RHOB|nr:hypothetical protein [Rubellimicrobium rubrum]TNC45138.1 hypothetical protein FHG66_20305 [Rubellimicrobium rubrum]
MGHADLLDFKTYSIRHEGWPIEIGIARIVGNGADAESRLIRPHPNLDPSLWSCQSEAIHGLSRDLVEAEGIDPAGLNACFAVLNDSIVVSDAPTFERRWLLRLLRTRSSLPSMRLRDFDSFLAMTLPDSAAPARAWGLFERHAVPHRAAGDVLRLACACLAGRRT